MASNDHQSLRSISRNLLLSFLATWAVVTIVFTLIQTIIDYRSKTAELESVVKGMDVTLIPSLEDNLWDAKKQEMTSQLKSILNSMDASKIRLTNATGEIVFEDSKKDFRAEHPETMRYKLTSSRHEPNERLLGHLEIVFYKDKILSEIKNGFFMNLLINCLKIFTVASILLFVSHRKIGKPFGETTSYLKSQTENIIHRENALDNWPFTQTQKVKDPETSLNQTDESIRQEKLRAETATRLAQLGEMATGIAHEINNPLAIISGYNHFIRSELKHPEPRMDKVMNAIDSMEKTILRITHYKNYCRTSRLRQRWFKRPHGIDIRKANYRRRHGYDRVQNSLKRHFDSSHARPRRGCDYFVPRYPARPSHRGFNQ
jgi:hypothetical protein